MGSTYRAAFIGNLVNFMTANDYDGIDLDMEEMAAADAAPYVAFATALRAGMTAAKPGSLLTAAVTWDPSAFAQLNGVFDHINLETYSLSGTWYNETWHNAPVYSAAAIGGGTLASVNSMVQQFETAGVSAAKLGVGITFDPYVWTGGSGVTKPQQTWSSAPTVAETYYYTIAKTYGLVEGAATSAAGSVYGWDSSAQAAYLSATGSPASNDAFVSYDDVTAINAKIAYANANGIGSVIIWDLAGGWRTDLPAGQQGRLLAAIKSAAYGTTIGTGTAAPVISAVAAGSVGSSSATVIWTTNEAADAQVEYGLTAAYGATTPLNAALTTNHSAVLSGLSAGTLYHYAVMSGTAAGAPTTSADASFATTAAAPTTSTVQIAPFINNFSSNTLNTCFADGSTFAPWTSSFSGYGCNQVEASGARFWLDVAPFVSTAASLTHAALVLGPAFAAPIAFSADLYTTAQLRRNTPPNPWEVGWLLWNYTDNSHFYYFQAKPNGWELGKEDPAYPGSQRFLATGTSPTFPIGSWYIVKIVQTQNTITIYVNGRLITTFTDTLAPYTAGNIGFYVEDSEARFENIAVNVTPGNAAPTVAVLVPAAAAPAAIATVSGTTTILALTSNDADVALVQFLLDGAPLGAAVANPPFSLAWNTSADASGSHSLSAILWDAEGDSSVSAGVPIIVNNTVAAGAPGNQAKAPQKFLSPALPDGINDVATFGPSATDVSVYNVRGRLVFHGSQQDGASIVWNCKDGSGRVDESGVYIAKIKTASSGVLYQSFALVK